MQKKKYVFFALGGVAIFALATGSSFFFYKKSEEPVKASAVATSQGGEIALGQANQSDSISLDQAPETDENTLKVDTGTNATNPSQLGSGQTNSSASSASESVPGPESFKQYEQYKNGTEALFGDIRAGTGNAAAPNKKVAVFYKGYLTNGTLFDETKDPSKPFIFTVGANQVIRGWEQAILGMKVGGIRRMVIPPYVGYGAAPQGSIPANSVLVFDVELVAVE